MTRYSYDDKNRLIKLEAPSTNGLRSVSDYSYDSSDNVTQVSTRVGSSETRTIRYQYFVDGNLREAQDALGNTQRRTYNSAGKLLTETAFLTPDSDGAGTTGQPGQPLTSNYIYDDEQHLLFLVSPEGRVTEYKYNAVGQQTDVIQYAGSAYSGSTYTKSALDSWAGGLSDKTKAQRTYYAYDFRGQVSSITRYGTLDPTTGAGVNDSNASTTYFLYDPAGRLLQTIDPRGSQSGTPGQAYVTSFTYDGLGRVLTATDNTGQVSATVYQSATHQVVYTSPQGLTTTREYNLAGELIKQTQEKVAGDTSSPALAPTITAYAYDDLGRLRMTTDPVGLRTYLLYDARGWKVADIGAEGSLTEYFYNDAGQVTGIRRYSTPLAVAQLEMLVDANGEPVTYVVVNGVRTLLTIDLLLGRTPTGTNNALPQLDLNGVGAGNDYAATVSSSGVSAAVDSANLTLNAGGDGTTLYSATAIILNPANGASELLSIASGSLPSGMTATYDNTRNLLTIRDNGNAPRSLANFQTALRGLRYQNTAAAPIQGQRQIQIVVNDGADYSTVATSRLLVGTPSTLDLNGAAAGTSYSASYTENAAAVAIVDVAALTVTDVDSASLSGATARITNILNAGLETLSVSVGSTGITANYNSSTGVLTLSGASSVANYQTVLRTLKYRSTSENPATTARTIEVSVNDGAFTSNIATATVSVAAVNDAATISGASTTATYTEDAVPVVAVNAGLTLSDVDNANLTGATLTLTSRPDGSVETLSVDVGSTGITASYNSSTGVLTLSGSSSVANYQAVLRTLKYVNTSQNPTAGNRSISLVVNDGTANSAAATTTVTVVPVNDAATISSASTTATYTEDTAPVVVVNAGLTLSDVDGTVLAGATITLVSRPNGNAETLSVDVGSTGITASYNVSTGVLTLSGSSSVANYQTVLRTLKYRNTSQNPTAGNRSISLVVNDGTADSAAVTTIVNVVPVNDAATISNASTTATYTEDTAPVVVVNAGLTLSDVDGTTLAGATITLTSRPNGSAEVLSVDVGSTGITTSYNASTGVLTLSGSSSVANYQAVLRTLKYQNTSQNPTAGNRSISLVVNDGTANSAAATTTVTVVPVNDAATISSASTTATYTEDAVPVVVVNAGLTLSDVDNANLTGATITLSSRPDGSVETLSVDVGSTGITASYNSSTGVLTLSGSSSVANYQAVLRTLKYVNTSQTSTAGNRSISLVVNDGAVNSAAATTIVNVVPVNDLTVIGGGSSGTSFTEDSPAIAINPGLTLSDVDSSQIVGARVRLVSNPDGAAENFASVDVGSTGITVAYDSATGYWNLTGTASLADYQQVLRTVTYRNTSQNPTAGARIIEMAVNDGSDWSDTLQTIINIVPVNDAPVVDLSPSDPTKASSSVAFPLLGNSVLCAPDIVLTDVDSETLASATITLDGAGALDSLAVTNRQQTGITPELSSIPLAAPAFRPRLLSADWITSSNTGLECPRPPIATRPRDIVMMLQAVLNPPRMLTMSANPIATMLRAIEPG